MELLVWLTIGASRTIALMAIVVTRPVTVSASPVRSIRGHAVRFPMVWIRMAIVVSVSLVTEQGPVPWQQTEPTPARIVMMTEFQPAIRMEPVMVPEVAGCICPVVNVSRRPAWKIRFFWRTPVMEQVTARATDPQPVIRMFVTMRGKLAA